MNGYFIDKDGKSYQAEDYFYRLEELKQPRFFSTEHRIAISRDDKSEPLIPVGLEIGGYSTTAFSDKIVEISLD